MQRAGQLADHFFTVVVQPLGAGRTREHFEIYYVGETALADELAEQRAANAAQWRVVFEEDRGVVEGMQRGRASPAFRGGAFSPVMDGPTHCFHKWMARALQWSIHALDGNEATQAMAAPKLNGAAPLAPTGPNGAKPGPIASETAGREA